MIMLHHVNLDLPSDCSFVMGLIASRNKENLDFTNLFYYPFRYVTLLTILMLLGNPEVVEISEQISSSLKSLDFQNI